jgi:hypothetical protein
MLSFYRVLLVRADALALDLGSHLGLGSLDFAALLIGGHRHGHKALQRVALYLLGDLRVDGESEIR